MEAFEALVYNDSPVPKLSTFSFTNKHRTKTDHQAPFNACVARPVGKAEIAREPDAQKAIASEWQRLRANGTWNEPLVEEWQDIARRHWRAGTKAHVGRVFNICVEKHSELTDKAKRKYKGRTVFQGN